MLAGLHENRSAGRNFLFLFILWPRRERNVTLPQKRSQSFYRPCKIQGLYPTNYPRSLPESYSIVKEPSCQNKGGIR
jgi:hypothetical protein